MKSLLIALIAIVMLTGCQAPKQLTQAEKDYLQTLESVMTTFDIDKDKERDAWGRAQSFVTKYAEPFAIVTEFVLETQVPKKKGKGNYFKIVKTPLADKIRFTVECRYYDPVLNDLYETIGRITTRNERACSYFIQTGIAPIVSMTPNYWELY